MKLAAVVSVAFLALAACVTPAMAWDVVGVREVGDRTDHDVVSLGGHRQFTRIKLCVYRNPVHFYDLDVFFRNGGHQDVPVAARINAGGCTRSIDLVGGARDIDRISLTYEETSFRRRTATVRVLAE